MLCFLIGTIFQVTNVLKPEVIKDDIKIYAVCNTRVVAECNVGHGECNDLYLEKKLYIQLAKKEINISKDIYNLR